MSPSSTFPLVQLPAFDLNQTHRFLEALKGSSDPRVCFQTFSDNKERCAAQPWNGHGCLSQLGPQLCQSNTQGSGIFVTVSQTNGSGRKAEDITSVLAFFIDHDIKEGLMKAELALPPSISVVSGGGKHHYWLLSTPVEPHRFKDVQKQLAAYYGTDPAVCDPSRVMRLPGFYHHKTDTPFLVQLEKCDGNTRYTIEQILAAHPVPEVKVGLAKHSHRSRSAQTLRHGPIPEGGRNDTLTRIGGALRARGSDDVGIREQLLEINAARCKPPLPDDEVQGIAASVAKYPIGFAHTEVGNAKRLVDLYADRIRYCAAWGQWLIYDGVRWKPDGDKAIWRLAQAAIDSMAREAHLIEGDDEASTKRRAHLLSWVATSEKFAQIRSMIKLAETEEEILIDPDQLDRDPLLVNCPNGTVDLRTGELRAHDPQDLCTQCTEAHFDSNATCLALESVLDFMANGDAEYRAFLPRLFGYSITGLTDAEAIFLLVGRAGAGKTALSECLKRALGDYACTVDTDAFLESDRRGNPKTQIAGMKGKRLVVASELRPNQRLAADDVKRLTGGDTVSARLLYQNETQFIPKCKIWIGANDVPIVAHDDEGIWRRLIRIPFDRAVPENQRDPAIKKALLDPNQGGAAMLALAVRGCRDWLAKGGGRKGLAEPHVIQTATSAYRTDMDRLNPFFSDAGIVLDPTSFVLVNDLYELYEKWAATNRVSKPMNRLQFTKDMKRRPGVTHLPQKKIDQRNVSVWQGIRVPGVGGHVAA